MKPVTADSKSRPKIVLGRADLKKSPQELTIKVAWPNTLSNGENRALKVRENMAKDQPPNSCNISENTSPQATIRSKTPNIECFSIKNALSAASARSKQSIETFFSSLNIKPEKESFSSLKDFVNSKMIDDKAFIDRSYKISQMRKTREGPERINRIKPEIKSCRSSPKLAGDKTLTRFVDQLILTGALPLEAVEYFTPDNQTMKEEKKKITLATYRPKISVSANSSPRRTREEITDSLHIDVVPNWMKASIKKARLSIPPRKLSQNPLSKILLKDPAERDLSQTTFVAKWLSGIQILAKLPYEKLVDISKILDPVYLQQGEVLCSFEDQAECAYIVYEGQIEIFSGQAQAEKLIGKAGPGDVLGRQALEQIGKRGIKLKASMSSFLVALPRSSYQNILAEIKPSPAGDKATIYNFIESHDFLRTFTEVKKHMLANHLSLQRFLKNEIVYELGCTADSMFIVKSGRVVRTIPVTMDKTNKWPTGVRDWRIWQVVKTYSVTLPIRNGEIFGVSEMIDMSKRKEQILVDEDAEILMLSRKMFYKIFEEDDIYRFQTKVKEDDARKAEKIKKMFQHQDNLQRVKAVAMTEAFNFNLNSKTHFSFKEVTEKAAAWKKFEKGMTKPKSRDKVVVSVEEITKDVHSVYET